MTKIYPKFAIATVCSVLGILAMEINPTVAIAATLVEIDFNDLAPGTIVTDQFASQGVKFSLLEDTTLGISPIAGPLANTLFADVFPPASGIAIYAGESCCNASTDVFFDIELSFSQPIDYFSILSLDSDEPISALGYLNGALAQSISFPGGSDIQVYQLELGNLGGPQLFDRVVLDTVRGGPEIFDNLTYNIADASSVPEPTAVLGLSMLGLGFLLNKKLTSNKI